MKRMDSRIDLIWDGEPPPSEVLSCFDEASNIITSLIVLKQPVRVRAKWDKLISTEAGTTLLGSASPLDFCAVDSSTALYPSALLHQLGGGDCGKFDIECSFNSEVHWNTDPRKTSLAEGETDLTSVILHEFMHGIGFSGLITETKGHVLNTAALGTAVKFDDNICVLNANTNNVTQILGGQWSDLREPTTSSQLVYVVQTPESGERYAIPLYSPPNYEPGRSIYHLDIDREKDPENQLMLPDLPMGIVVRHPGPAALAIMQSIGYQLVRSNDLGPSAETSSPAPGSPAATYKQASNAALPSVSTSICVMLLSYAISMYLFQ